MDQPLVTIVTPSLNQAPFLRATIESVLRQDYPRIEYIVMDGGSTDGSAAIAAEYASRLTWISEKDNGQSHAINKGFRMARGEIVAWLNSDDLLLDGAVSHAVRGLERHPRAGAVYGEGYLIDREGAITCRFPHTQPFDLWRLTHLSDYILQQTVFFRRAVVEQVGYLREDLHFAMDWDLLIRIGKRCPLVFLPEYLGCLREYPEAKSFSGGRRRIREIRDVLREHSGSRFPPGWIIYGVDTLLQDWRRRLPGNGGLLSPLAGIAGRALAYMGGRIIERALGAQGLYSDGWAGPRVRLMLPAGDGSLRIEGMLPGTGWLAGQTLDLSACGHTLRRLRVDPGDFVIEAPVPPSLQGRPLDLEILATHRFIPAYSNASTDFRQLCYLLRRVSWAESAAPPETAQTAAHAS